MSEMLEDPLRQPLDRLGRYASHSPHSCDPRPHRPEGYLFLQLVPVLAPHVAGESPDPAMGEGAATDLNAAGCVAGTLIG